MLPPFLSLDGTFDFFDTPFQKSGRTSDNSERPFRFSDTTTETSDIPSENREAHQTLQNVSPDFREPLSDFQVVPSENREPHQTAQNVSPEFRKPLSELQVVPSENHKRGFYFPNVSYIKRNEPDTKCEALFSLGIAASIESNKISSNNKRINSCPPICNATDKYCIPIFLY